MKTLSSGQIYDGGLTNFNSVAYLDDNSRLILTFEGVIRVDNPSRYLSSYLDELTRVLPQYPITSTLIEFTKLRFCNSNGFYFIMDIINAVYDIVPGPVTVKRLINDDWQQETLPILLNLQEDDIATRTTLEDVQPA